MRRWMAAFATLSICLASGLKSDILPVIVDGQLNDPFWRHLSTGKLWPSEDGVTASMGGEIQAAIAGNYLYLSAHLPEPGGRIMANSVGFDPVWEGGDEAREIAFFHLYNGEREGEDYVRFVIRNYNENDWMLQVGPLGAYSVSWRWTGKREWYTSDPRKCNRFLVATKINTDSWNVEAALPLDQLGSPGPGGLQLSVERNRAQRPKSPRESWYWPEHQPTARVSSLQEDAGPQPKPVFRPTLLGNNEPPITVGYRKTLPPVDSVWSDPAWQNVPSLTLRRNEAARPLSHFPTDVKLLHDGNTVALIARCTEPDQIVAQAQERDGAVEHDDSFQVYLATSGSRYVQYAINPSGVLLDAYGNNGTVRLSLPHREWNSPVRGTAWRDRGAWYARLNLPLAAAAEVLGDTQPPNQWKILLMRNRPGRQGEPREESVLPVTQSNTAYCPARYRRVEFAKLEPSKLPTQPSRDRADKPPLVPTQVFSPAQRAQMNLSGMMNQYYRSHILEYLKSEKQDWDQVKTVEDWQQFRDPRLKKLRAALGKFPARCPLDTHVTGEYRGNDYRRENLVYQSQPGIWVTANLYLPVQSHAPMPGILILPALHNAKPQWELQDMGIMWAKAGCAVLIVDQVGYGERMETHPWDKEYINARYVEGEQIYLTGSSLLTWMIWDAMRGIDLLLDQSNVDKNEIVLLGAVAGGGDPAAVTAALDPRVAAVVPFNFGEAMPETSRFISYKNQWPLDLAEPTVDEWDTTRVIPRNVVDGFLQWMICASVAPRRFVYSYELGWNVEDLPAWSRYQKVYALYNAAGNLSEAHGFGPFPGPGESENIGPSQRRSLEPTLEHWFGIPVNFADVQSSPLANLAERPSIDRRPVPELTVLTPSVAAQLPLKNVHEVAYEQGQSEVQNARSALSTLAPEGHRHWLASQWAEKLGDIGPNPHPQATIEWTKDIPGARAEAIRLDVEPGIAVPVIFLHPVAAPIRGPVVVAVAEGGKELFVTQRREQVEALLQGGVAVCLLDVRGTGETGSAAEANTALALGETVLGERLRDLRTVLVYLRDRSDVDPHRFGLWGDSFAPPNPSRFFLEETPLWRIGPQVEQNAEPLGGLLALLGSLYEDGVHAVAVQGGLVSYLSVLEDNFAYVPQDVIVPGLLEAGDIADVAAALAPRPLLLQGLVNGRDQLVPVSELKDRLAPAYEAYGGNAAAEFSLRPGENASQFAQWFIAHLSSPPSRRASAQATP
jgi:dienelactone hydrolase